MINEVPGYEMLRKGLDAAYDQSAKGKGAKRHADNKPFDQQPIMLTTRRHGEGFPMGQAEKKIGEAAGMISRGEIEAARHEILGAIVYLVAAWSFLEEKYGE